MTMQFSTHSFILKQCRIYEKQAAVTVSYCLTKYIYHVPKKLQVILCGVLETISNLTLLAYV